MSIDNAIETLNKMIAVLDRPMPEMERPATIEQPLKIDSLDYADYHDDVGVPHSEVGSRVKLVYGNVNDHRGASVLEGIVVAHPEDINLPGRHTEAIAMPLGLAIYDGISLGGTRHILYIIRYNEKARIEDVLGKGTYDTFCNVMHATNILHTEIRDLAVLKSAL